jgi:hypothetical protein
LEEVSIALIVGVVGYSSSAKRLEKKSYKFLPLASTVILPLSGISITPSGLVKVKSLSK